MANFPMMATFSNVIRNRNGNFAMMAAIVLPVAFMAGSLAIDTTNAMSMKTRMQNAVDSAALATATRLLKEKTLTESEAKTFAEKFLISQIQEDLPAFANMAVTPNVTVTPVTSGGSTVWKVSVGMSGTQTLTPMARLLGQESLTVNVVGKSESGSNESQGSFSMTLVLDQSGSMGWTMGGEKKIKVLKKAVKALVDQIKAADKKSQFTRIGAAGYASSLKGTLPLGWDTNKLVTFVTKLQAKGGTDSTDAFAWGYVNVNDKLELAEHKKMTGQVPKKFIVFMTDGDNNYHSADTSTKILCDRAKKDGVTVYTVAFAAPKGGKALLSYCATSPEHYFDASNSAELISAFENIGQQTSEIVSRLTQ